MKTTYVKNADGDMIYKVTYSSIIPNDEGREGYIEFNLDLVCGKDYVSEDYDYQGWCSPEYFVDDYKFDVLLQYFETETFDEMLEDNGYVRCEAPDFHIYEPGETPSDFDLMW